MSYYYNIILTKKETLTREKPWFDDDVDITEKRSKARQEMIQDPTPENVERYQELRKIASKKIRNVKREYEKQKIRNIEEYRRNPRLFFENADLSRMVLNPKPA